MDPPYHNNSQPPASSFLELKGDQTSSLSLSCPAFMNPTQDQGDFYYREPQRFQLQEADHKINVSSGGSSDDHHPRAEESREFEKHDLKLNIWKSTEDTNYETKNLGENINSVKWMSSKMRMMRKMIMNPDQTASNDSPINFTQKFEIVNKKHPGSPLGTDHSTGSSSNNNNNNNNNSTIRVCADCNTTKTPLWRSGPRGPKSLCNACGIRQRKARRAMAAAAAAANGTILAVDGPSMKNSTTTNKVQQKEKKSRMSGTNGCLPFKKRCKLTSPSRGQRKNKLCFEDLTISVSKNTAFQRVFPQDERDAAILLMALSYGLVHG